MQSALYYLTTLAVLAVLVVLCMGLYSLLGQRNSNLSQKLMRWRVGLQFVAILLIDGKKSVRNSRSLLPLASVLNIRGIACI